MKPGSSGSRCSCGSCLNLIGWRSTNHGRRFAEGFVKHVTFCKFRRVTEKCQQILKIFLFRFDFEAKSQDSSDCSWWFSRCASIQWDSTTTSEAAAARNPRLPRRCQLGFISQNQGNTKYFFSSFGLWCWPWRCIYDNNYKFLATYFLAFPT